MLGDRVELFFHGLRVFHRPVRKQRHGGGQRFRLDVDLGAEPTAEERHPNPDLVLRQPEET